VSTAVKACRTRGWYQVELEVYSHRDRCAIVGIGATDFSRKSGRSDLTLATQAALAALDDAGLSPADVDGIVRCDMDLVRHNDLADSLGIRDLTFWSTVGVGGVAPCGMIGQAVAAIMSGQATTVLVFRELNGRSGRRYGLSSESGHAAGGEGSYDEFFAPYGMLTPGQVFATMAQRHMLEFGTKAEELGQIALTCRKRANANPAAQMYGRPLTMDDYLAARMISRPLRLFDFCLESDGACAVVVTSTERARDCRQAPVLIRAVAQSGIPNPQPGIQFPVLMRESITELPARAVASTLFRRAGLGPDDVDVAQLYDCFTITVLLELEDWGFCKKGEGGPFVASGEIDLGGKIPINTAGGNLSEGYIHGMTHVLEGVRQIRGDSTSQVPGAEVCLVASTPLPPGSALLLTAA
jgi:acetyl-CoA acetyltransferase